MGSVCVCRGLCGGCGHAWGRMSCGCACGGQKTTHFVKLVLFFHLSVGSGKPNSAHQACKAGEVFSTELSCQPHIYFKIFLCVYYFLFLHSN